jgi:hypothetical protein
VHFTCFVDNRSVNGKPEAHVRGKKAKGPHQDRKVHPSSEKKCAVSKLIPEEPILSG